MTDLQGHVPPGAGGDEGDRAVEDDEPFGCLLNGADLEVSGRYFVQIRLDGRVVAGRVLVYVTQRHTAFNHGQGRVQRLFEPYFLPGPGGLKGEDLLPRAVRGVLNGRVDQRDTFEDGNGEVGIGAGDGGQGAKESARAAESRMRSWISRVTGCRRCESAADGGTGRIQPSSWGSGWTRANSTRHGASSRAERGSRPALSASV